MGNDQNRRQNTQIVNTQMRRTFSSQNLHNEKQILNSSQQSQRTNVSQLHLNQTYLINTVNNQAIKSQTKMNINTQSNNNINNNNNFNNANSRYNTNYINNNNKNYNTYSTNNMNNSNNNTNNNYNANNTNKNNNTNNDNKKISNYTFIKDLGKGQTGKVGLYRSNINQQLVAIKEIVIPDVSEKEKNNLKKEPQILQMIKNPYIIQFYQDFEEDNKLYIVMEYCENNDLNSYINKEKKNNNKISESFIWKVAYQVLNALKYLHIEKKMVHKDIKPENLLIDKNENIKLGDFSSSGIMPIYSKIATAIRMTYKNNSHGFTPLFKCPEKNITFKSDIWSLGVTLYYLAKLRYPFDGNDEEEVKYNIINKVQEDLGKEYSSELNKIIKVMLTKDPLKRPSAYDCMEMIPSSIREKYEKPKNNSFENFLFQMFMASIGIGDLPPELKEEFNDLYLIVSEFPKLIERNLLCNKCEKIPIIKINYNLLEVSSECELGHFQRLNIKDFYRIFSDQRNEIKSNICSRCNHENEFEKKKIYYKFCKDCKQILCTNCEEIHNEENPEHNIFDSLIEYNSRCKTHLEEPLSYFCQDCFINLCESCISNHDKKNIGHNIEKTELIDEKIIINAKNNINNIKKQIIKCENNIKSKRTNNKFVLLLKLNFVKLFLLYKFTFINMYEENPTNYITIKNFLDNNLEILDIKLDEDKSKTIIYNIFTPLFNKSINGFEQKKKEKNILNDENGNNANNELIDLFEVSYYKYLAFSKFGVKKINDIDSLDCCDVKKININNVYRLKDGRFLISESNKLKIYKYNEENDQINFDLDFEFPEFSKNNISSFLELINGKLIVLSEGIITIFKKKENEYKVYKNNFHLLEKIYSMVEFNEKSFITISEIKDEDRCCHLEIWDSESLSITYNSTRHYWFPKHQYNILKITNDLIMVMIDKSEVTNYTYAFLLFNVENKTFEIDKRHSFFTKIIKISDGCFIGISKDSIEQYELLLKNNLIKSTTIGFKEIEDVKNVLISEGKLIAFNKNGNILVFE